MSWLRQTVNNSLSQIGGQLKDILTETSEDIIDPDTELKAIKEKVKEQERYIEILKQECVRLNSETNESIEKFQALEIQLENLSIESKKQLTQKDAIIADLRDQLNQIQTMTSEKSAFMDFEEIMPSSELNDYIHLQKEIKRLQDENRYLLIDNQQLNDKVQSNVNQMNGNKFQNDIDALHAKIKYDNDRHQQEIISIQSNYNEKLNSILEAHKCEIEKIKNTKNDGWNVFDDEIQLKDEKPEIEDQSDVINELKQRNEDFLADLNKLTNDNKHLNNELDILNEKNKKLEIEVEKLSVKAGLNNDDINVELSQMRDENLNLNKVLNEKEKEKTKLLESIDLKTNEILQLKNNIMNLKTEFENLNEDYKDMQNNCNKLQADNTRLIQENENLKVEFEQKFNNNELEHTINALQHERSQIYFYLQQKSEESLNYYNEIQRLNNLIIDLNKELLENKDKYSNLENDLSLETKLVDDLNDETQNLKQILNEYKQEIEETKLLANDTSNASSGNIDKSDCGVNTVEYKDENVESELRQAKDNVEQLRNENVLLIEKFDVLKLKEQQIELELKQSKENLNYLKNENFELTEKLNALQFDLKRVSAERDQIIMSLKESEIEKKRLMDMQHDNLGRSNKELERLREHLVEMSDNYTKEAILAEQREKELRSMLAAAEENIQSQNSSIINANKEAHKRNQDLTFENQDLKEEKQRLINQLKQVEDSYQNQLKVTKNLELLMERLQKDKEAQQNIEIKKYQDTIKQNAITIHNLQNDAANYEAQLDELKEIVSAASRLNEQLEKKDEIISGLQQRAQGKEDQIVALELKLNEVQKINSNYVEKEIIKNLLIGYLKVNVNERKQVLKLIGSMLNFTPNDYEQINQNNSDTSKWLSGLFGQNTRASPNKTEISGVNKSFTELLIQYVDNESKPKPRIALGFSNILNAGDSPLSTNKKTDSPILLKTPLQQSQLLTRDFNENPIIRADLISSGNYESPLATNRFSNSNINTNNKFLEDALN